MKLEEMPVTCDLSETSLDDARIRLGANWLHQVKVWCGPLSAKHARQVQGAHGFELVVVPDSLLPGPFAWAVEWNGRLIGSKGCD